MLSYAANQTAANFLRLLPNDLVRSPEFLHCSSVPRPFLPDRDQKAGKQIEAMRKYWAEKKAGATKTPKN